MKKMLMSMLLGMCALSLNAELCMEPTKEVATVQYGYRRPFSFYYPYRYKFYYPRRQYHPSSQNCYWRYLNGTYVYYCE